MSGGEPSGRARRRGAAMAAVTRAVYGLERSFEFVRHRVTRPFLNGPLIVEPYLGYGNGRTLRVRARVLLDRGVVPANPEDGPMTNLRNAWRRFDSAEVAGARLRVTVPASDAGGAPDDDRLPLLDVEATCDDEGHLDAEWALSGTLLPGFRTVRYELLDPIPRRQVRTRFEGEAAVVAGDAPFGVISDIDDTVLVTGATRFWRVLTRTLLQSAHDRTPFPGVAALYRAFADQGVPLFYVSSSPWNLYAVLARFLQLNDIPPGPLLLRDWGITATELLPLGHGDHKLAEIEAVMRAFPRLRFVLIGDSGQEDPEIYAEVVRREGDRVAGVLIRHVGDDARARAVSELSRTLSERGVPLHLVRDSAEAARHAERHGWIDAAARDATERAIVGSLSPGSSGRGAARG